MIVARTGRWSVGYAKRVTGMWRGAVTVAALVAVLTMALAPHVPHALPLHDRIAPPPPSADPPAALVPQANGALATDDPAYAVAAAPDDSGTLRAANPAQHFAATFAPDGVRVTAHRAQWGLRLVAVGDGEARTSIEVPPDARGNRVTYPRGALTEWYENGPLGLEQGFTLASPVAGRLGNLTLTLSFTGDTTPMQEGDAVTLALPGGALRYGDLRAMDATGRVLPSRMVLDGKTLRLTAEDAGAVYPVTVDPLVQQSELTASDGAANDFFTMSVAASGSGASQVFVVGAVGKTVGGNASQGAAYVFTPNGIGGYSQQRLTASDGAANDNFGNSVAVIGSGASTVIVVGAPGKGIGGHSQQGAAYVFTPNGGGYTQQQLLALDGAAMDQFGASVAVGGSGAATTIIVGASGKMIGGNSRRGAAYIFTPNGSGGYGQQQLLALDGAASDLFGASVAVGGSSATTAIVVGASGKTVGGNASQGAAYVFTPNGVGGYAQQRLTASDGTASDQFGISVAVSGTGAGMIIAIGAWTKTINGRNSQGAAYVFTPNGGGYAEQRLTASDGAVGDSFGLAVAVSGTGATTTIVVGAFAKTITDHSEQGETYVYTPSGGGYSEQRLFASDGATMDQFGASVAVSGSGAGATALIGAVDKTIGGHAFQGALYLFAPGSPSPLPSPKPTAPPAAGGPPSPLPSLRPTVAPAPGGPPNPLPTAR